MLVALFALALGAELWVAVVVGFAVGLFVGGGLGLLLAARSAELGLNDIRSPSAVGRPRIGLRR